MYLEFWRGGGGLENVHFEFGVLRVSRFLMIGFWIQMERRKYIVCVREIRWGHL